MNAILLDPYVLACPNVVDGKEKYEEFIHGLLEWQPLLKCDWAHVYLGAEIAKVLFELNKYPLWDDLKEINRFFGIDYIPADTIVAIISSFLAKFGFLEDELLVLDIDYYDFNILPDEISKRSEPTLNRILEQMLICLDIHKKYFKKIDRGFLALNPPETNLIQYKYILKDILFEDMANCVLEIPSEQMSEILVFNNFNILEDFLNTTLIESKIHHQEKPIKLSGDHHGNEKLLVLAKKLVTSSFVEGVINNLPFNSNAKEAISKIHDDGKVEIVLIDTDKGFGMVIQTTGRNYQETKEIAYKLKAKFKF